MKAEPSSTDTSGASYGGVGPDPAACDHVMISLRGETGTRNSWDRDRSEGRVSTSLEDEREDGEPRAKRLKASEGAAATMAAEVECEIYGNSVNKKLRKTDGDPRVKAAELAAELDFENFGKRFNSKIRKTSEQDEEQTSEILRCLGLKPPHAYRAAAAFTMYSSFKHSSSRSSTIAAANLVVASMRRHGRTKWHQGPPRAA